MKNPSISSRLKQLEFDIKSLRQANDKDFNYLQDLKNEIREIDRRLTERNNQLAASVGKRFKYIEPVPGKIVVEDIPRSER